MTTIDDQKVDPAVLSNTATTVPLHDPDAPNVRRQIQHIFQLSPVAIGILRGQQLVVELANNALLHIWDRTAENVLGKPLFDLFPQARGQGHEELLLSVLQTGQPYFANEHAVRLQRHGWPEIVYFNFVYQPLGDGDGTRNGIIVVGNDITAQVEARQHAEASEQRHQLALTAAQMGVWDLDLITDTSVRTLRHDQIFGYQSMQPVWSGAMFMEHVVPDDRPYARACFESAYQTSSLHLECRTAWPDGSIHWINAQGHVYYDDEGVPKRMLGVITDTTDRKELETRRDTFLSVASHELRTPITAIKGMTELLLRTVDKREASSTELRALKTIVNQVDRLARLVDDMLDISRIDAGKLAISFTNVDLHSLITNLLNQHQLLHPNHRLTYNAAQPVLVWGDADRLQQVMFNLISNAIQHAPAGSEIQTRLHLEDNQVIVSVHNQGPEIALAKQAHIFERFYQGEEQPARGLGLGLYIAREIVEQHHGKIWVDSEAGEGSTFHFSLPTRNI
ncbi:MAG: ATP-binding protein [Herpetosiphon sp.]